MQLKNTGHPELRMGLAMVEVALEESYSFVCRALSWIVWCIAIFVILKVVYWIVTVIWLIVVWIQLVDSADARRERYKEARELELRYYD